MVTSRVTGDGPPPLATPSPLALFSTSAHFSRSQRHKISASGTEMGLETWDYQMPAEISIEIILISSNGLSPLSLRAFSIS